MLFLEGLSQSRFHHPSIQAYDTKGVSYSAMILWVSVLTLGVVSRTRANPAPPAAPGSVAVRPRARAGGGHSRFDVRQPPFGFVVDGSSLQELNGVYGPRLPRRRPSDGQVVEAPPAFAEHVHVGAYAHDSSGWWLVNLRRPARHAGREENRESNRDDAVQTQGSDEAQDRSPLTELSGCLSARMVSSGFGTLAKV